VAGAGAQSAVAAALVVAVGGGAVAGHLGLWVAVGSAYLVTAYAALRAWLARRLLVQPPVAGERARVAELTRSRARLVGAYEAERRRLERDIHDGVQQRVTGPILTIGLARLDVATGQPAARALVGRAQDEARQTLAELRDLVRGIHPAVLTDRGLQAAAVAADSSRFQAC
jgi:signal transduction histidine kinase